MCPIINGIYKITDIFQHIVPSNPALINILLNMHKLVDKNFTF